MRLGKRLWLVVSWIVAWNGYAADSASTREALIEAYLSEVQVVSHHLLESWTDELLRPDNSTPYFPLQLHAIPFDEADLPRHMRRFGIFRFRLPYGERRSTSHLNEIRELTEKVRSLERFTSLRPVTQYGWIESDLNHLLAVIEERLRLEMNSLREHVAYLHAPGIVPTAYEIRQSLRAYFEVWLLAAVWQVETERFLKSFPFPAVHRERLQLRRETAAETIRECRVALLRISHPRYQW